MRNAVTLFLWMLAVVCLAGGAAVAAIWTISHVQIIEPYRDPDGP